MLNKDLMVWLLQIINGFKHNLNSVVHVTCSMQKPNQTSTGVMVQQAKTFHLQYRVKTKMLKLKLSQKQLCKDLGIGSSSFSRWLNGLTAKMNPLYLVQITEM